MTVGQMKDDIVKKDKRKFLTFLIFLVISTALWLVIKLTKEYTTQTTFYVTYTEVPVNKWVSSSGQPVKLSFVANGFITLRHNLVGNQNRTIEIPLDAIPYRLEGGTTYSYSSQYIAERVAEWLSIPTGDVTVNDDKHYFNMEDLQSKVLPVCVPLQITMPRQYQLYGTPVATPSTLTVFGPKTVLDTMMAVYTDPLHRDNVSEDFNAIVNVDLYDGEVRSENETVEVFVDVEQFTEMEFEVPVTVTDTLNLRFFPETMRLKCLVAIKDYASVKGSSFLVLADTAQLHRLQPLLDLHVAKVPEHVQVLNAEPEQVEYLIIN